MYFPFFISDIMEFKYEDEDFGDLLLNVHSVPKKENVVDHFPDFKKYEEFKGDLGDKAMHLDKILRFIVYKYDRKCPLQDIGDLIIRKTTAAQLAGFKINAGGNFPVHVKEILSGTNKVVNAMIIRYCRMQYPAEWALVVAGNEAYFSVLEDMMNDSGKKKQDLFTQAGVMVKELDVTRQQLFNGEESRIIDEDLYRVIEEEASKQRRMSPENMAV